MNDQEKQLVVYGAGGWLGRSFVSTALERFNVFPESNLVLIGSKCRKIQVEKWELNVHSSKDALDLITPGAIFINSAFLRRENLTIMSPQDYSISNNEISQFAREVVETRQLSSFVNLSSGAAAIASLNSRSTIDIYGDLKRQWETKFREVCTEVKCNFINNRIYSISGRYINEFRNLALSTFIRKSLNNEAVTVNSPNAFRSYVDAEQLSEVVLKLSLGGFAGDLDSGGFLVNMEQLARLIVKVIGKGYVEVSESPSSAKDYLGNHQAFNAVAQSLGVDLNHLDVQILRTTKAFLKDS